MELTAVVHVGPTLYLYEFTCKFIVSLSGNHHFIIQALLVFIFYVSTIVIIMTDVVVYNYIV